ncbi:MAG: AbrB/MazE/SpoVT family DNA-binding domain-containing protein [Bacillota bacterium]|nr:AbrB/MazE/SpoVT family DNA-binding domain-containing protein [Bacillota bacterium]
MNNAQLNDRGQLTIPKNIREKLNLKPKDIVNIEVINNDRILISKRDIYDDLDDLIKRDLINEGCAPYELDDKIAEKKKELATALLKMTKDAGEDVSKGKYVTLDELEKELNEE